MVRGRRVMIEGGLYHVYNRFARGEGVFSDPAEAVEFAELLREVKERDGLAVFAWAILSNRALRIALPYSGSDVGDSAFAVDASAAGRFCQRFQPTLEEIGATVAEPVPSARDRHSGLP